MRSAASSPYRMLGERPRGEELPPRAVAEEAGGAVDRTADEDEEDFAAVRYVADDHDPGRTALRRGLDAVPLWSFLVAGFTVAFGSVAAWAMFRGR